MTHKAPRCLKICIACLTGSHHVGRLVKTEHGLACKCPCQEEGFQNYRAEIVHTLQLRKPELARPA